MTFKNYIKTLSGKHVDITQYDRLDTGNTNNDLISLHGLAMCFEDFLLLRCCINKEELSEGLAIRYEDIETIIGSDTCRFLGEDEDEDDIDSYIDKLLSDDAP